jgi:K+-sensing histidine kinase KdpD/DNA-binding response OmpR family regulator
MKTRKVVLKRPRKCISLFGFTLAFLLPISYSLYAQKESEKGLPFITNYSAKTFNALPQTWSMQQDENGMMYFGVQNYILEYDGLKWRKLLFPNNVSSNVCRSMAKSKDGVIYYGAFGDIGYLDNDSIGQKRMYSLLNAVPTQYRNFLDVWSTYATESGIYFQSRECIFRYVYPKAGSKTKQMMMKVWTPKTKFMYAFYIDGNYYVHQQGEGLYKMVNDSLVLIPGSEFLGKERMQIMLPYKKTASGENRYLIGLFYSGLYLFDGHTFQPFATNADPIIKSGYNLYKGIQLNNGNYVLSTTGKGLAIIDAQGNLLQKINRDVGLQDESIYAEFIDKKGSLWLALDNGISRVEIASPLTKFGLQSGITTGVLSINRFAGNLYIGMSNGLLAFNNNTAVFEPVPGMPGSQVFSLVTVGDEMFVPGDGLFSVRNKKAYTVGKSVGADLTLNGVYHSKKYPNILLGIGNFGAAVFQNRTKILSGDGSENWHFEGYIPGIKDQLWAIAENEDGTIWAGTQVGRSYLITLGFDETGNIDLKKAKFEIYGPEQGYKNGLGVVYSIKGINYFIADSAMYTFDDKLKRFKVDSTFGLFRKGGGNTEFDMDEDKQGRVWIRFGKEIRLAIPKPGGGYSIDTTLLREVSELTIQKIYPEENGIVWLCTTDGLIRFDENLEKENDPSFKTLVRSVSAGKNLLNPSSSSGANPFEISYQDNTLRFEYAAPFYVQEEKTVYQTWLEGFEKDWSEWGNNYYKEFTNLPHGNYKFHVKAMNIYQKVSDEAVYEFIVNPPWFQTWWAYLLYAITAFGIVYFLVRYRTKQLHEKHRELEKTVSDRTAELSQRVEELAVINSVQEALVSALDMQAIYNMVGDRIREVFDAQAVIIATFDHESSMEHFRYTIENGERFYPNPRPLDKLRIQLIQLRQKIVIKTTQEAFAWFGKNTVAGTKPLKSGVFVPLTIADKITSYISLQNVDKENAFKESDVRLLETLANSMSVALENARLFDETTRLLKETEQRTAELAVINSVQEGLARELDMQGIYKLIGDRLCSLFPDTETLVIRTFDQEKSLEHFHYTIENGVYLKIDPRPLIWESKQLIQTKKPLYIHENYVEVSKEYGESTVTEGEPVKSAIFVPMMVGDMVKGTISLQNVTRENAFTEPDIRLLTTLANSMSVALENARLFDETTRLLKETEQRTAELGVINSVQQGLAKELDMQAIYDLVGNKIRDLFDAQAVIIATFDHDNGTEHFKYVIEDGKQFYLNPRRFDKLRQHLIHTRQKIVINKDYAEAFSKFGLKILPGTKMTKSGLFVPLFIGDKVNSYISLQNMDRENAFSESDVRLLETLSNSMSVALENARLFDETTRLLKETEQRTAELAVINSVQEGLVREMDMQGIYDLVGDRLQKLFTAQAVIIASFNLQNKTEHFNYVFENGEKFKLEPRSIGDMRQMLIDKRCTIYIETEEKARTEYGITAIEDTKMPKSLLFVPLLSGNDIRGYVSLQNIDIEHAFSESNIRLLETLANSMTVALENARLFEETNRLLKETEQRKAELAVINTVQEGLVREMDMQAIYELMGKRLCELFNTQTVMIRTFDAESSAETWRYAIERGERLYSNPRPLIWANLELIKTKRYILINENYLDISRSRGGSGVTKGLPPKSALFVPLIVGDIVRGSVSLQNVEIENAFSESDVRLLTTLANSMSVALENARLFEETKLLLAETEKGKKNVELLSEIGKKITASLDFETIFYKLYEHINQLADATIFGVGIYHPNLDQVEYKFAIEKGKRYKPYARDTTDKNQLPVWCIENRLPVFINDLPKEYSRYISKYDTKEILLEDGSVSTDPLSLIYLPLIVKRQVLGIITIQSFQKNAYTEYHLNLLQNLATYTSIALDNAKAYRQLNEREQEIGQRAAELSTVNSISQAMASQLDPEELINLVGSKMRDLFKANIVYVAMLDHKSKIISFPYQYGDNLEPMKLGEGLTSQILLTGKPLLINKDVKERTDKLGLQRIGLPAASYLGVPIPVGDEIIGVLSIQTTEAENRFNENDQRLLSTIATSVGVALRKAKLFEEVQHAKMEAEVARKNAEKANEAKSAFLSTVSHELRTPLTSVLGFAKIIRKRLEEKIFPLTDKSDSKTGKTIQQVSENLAVVVSEGERLTTLINDVLDLAKIEAGKMEWNFENVSMPEIAERAIAATSSLFDQKNLTLQKHIETDLPLINGDRDKLIQVIVNLISNAVKFTPTGTIICNVNKKGNEIIVGIIDTGIGIAKEDFKAVFEQFRQVGGDTLTDKPKGTGLGLPICKEIVEHHGGRIWLESEQGKGSSFFFALQLTNAGTIKPMHLDDLVKQLKVQMAQSQLHVKGKNITILVVDDDDSIRSLLQQEFTDAGYNVEEASNGKQALERIRNNRPDLIILDIMMPEMNGFDVAAILKNDPQTMDIPIIVLSIVQDKARGYRIGVDRYLTKPIDTAALFAEVGTLLEQGKSSKKVMIVDEDSAAVKTLTDVLHAKGYMVVESDGKELMEKAISAQPDIIILNSVLSGKQEIVQSLRFEKGLENVLFLIYQ